LIVGQDGPHEKDVAVPVNRGDRLRVDWQSSILPLHPKILEILYIHLSLN